MAETGESRHQKRRALVERRLLEEGLKLLGAKGVQACKVEEITKAAGVGKGTFFTHFESKDAYLARLVDQVLDDLARRVGPLNLAPTDAESLLAGVGSVHLRFFQLRPEAAALIAQTCGLAGSDWFISAAARRLAQHLELVEGMVAPACPQIGWPREHARELALMLFSVSVGFFWLGRPLGLAEELPAALMERMGRALARGLAGGETAPALP
jgi:AcrR family transcriptional regulator